MNLQFDCALDKNLNLSIIFRAINSNIYTSTAAQCKTPTSEFVDRATGKWAPKDKDEQVLEKGQGVINHMRPFNNVYVKWGEKTLAVPSPPRVPSQLP